MVRLGLAAKVLVGLGLMACGSGAMARDSLSFSINYDSGYYDVGGYYREDRYGGCRDRRNRCGDRDYRYGYSYRYEPRYWPRYSYYHAPPRYSGWSSYGYRYDDRRSRDYRGHDSRRRDDRDHHDRGRDHRRDDDRSDHRRSDRDRDHHDRRHH